MVYFLSIEYDIKFAPLIVLVLPALQTIPSSGSPGHWTTGRQYRGIGEYWEDSLLGQSTISIILTIGDDDNDRNSGRTETEAGWRDGKIQGTI